MHFNFNDNTQSATDFHRTWVDHFCLWKLAACVCFTWLTCLPLSAQELRSTDPAELIGPAQRLAVQQIDTLIESGQLRDAVAQLQILQDLPPALIESSGLQAAATQFVQPYQPLRHWCLLRLLRALASDQPLRVDYDKQWSSLASSALRAVQRTKSPLDAREAASRFGATDQANALANLLADIHFEQGDFLAGAQCLDSLFPKLSRIPLRDIDPKAAAISVPWYRAWKSLGQNAKLAELLLQRWHDAVKTQPEQAVQLLWRLHVAAALAPEQLDFESIDAWTKVASTKLPMEQAQQLETRLADTNGWFGKSTVAARTLDVLFPLNQRHVWQSQLDRWINDSDVTPATRPAVGQIQAALPYFPIVYDRTVLLHELTKIKAFQLQDGKPWPTASSQGILFDSQTSSAAYLPLGYQLKGSPRAGLSVVDGCLYARMGSPVTAWNNRTSSNDGSSISYLIGLDLDKQGSMLRGFPLKLKPPQFQDAEFEGTPVAVGQAIVTVVTERDNVGIRRSLAAFDRFSGQLLWRTKALGAGAVVGSEGANLISASQPTVIGGLIYYCTDLGTVACVDLRSGQTVWLGRYQRANRIQSDFPKPNRYRYRDGNPCKVHQGLVYCLPQDCPELLALDAMNGDLVWSTDDEDLSDCTYQLSISGESLIVGGDRLVWLHRTTGAVLGQFPNRSTPGMVNALPQPRGLGRAFVVSDRVYWPAAQQVFVFQADVSNLSNKAPQQLDSPPLLQVIDSAYCGTEGGNLLAEGRWMLLATPGRLICFYAN